MVALDPRTERPVTLDHFTTEQLMEELARRDPPEPKVRAKTVQYVSHENSLYPPDRIVLLPKSVAEDYLKRGAVVKPTKEELAALKSEGEETPTE